MSVRHWVWEAMAGQQAGGRQLALQQHTAIGSKAPPACPVSPTHPCPGACTKWSTSSSRKHSHLTACRRSSVSSRTTSSTASSEVATRVGTGAGAWGRAGSDSMTHTITATSLRMCSHALLCSCSAAKRSERDAEGGGECACVHQ